MFMRQKQVDGAASAGKQSTWEVQEKYCLLVTKRLVNDYYTVMTNISKQ